MILLPKYNIISGTLDSLTISNDSKHLNWVKGKVDFGTPLATFYTDKIAKNSNGLSVIYELHQDSITLKVERRMVGNNYRETYTFTNSDEHKDISIDADKIGIYTPFNDSYDIAEVSLNRRCNAHIWCGGNCTYIYGLRMNGQDNNVGMVLTKGYIDKYGVERRWNSNDRGDFILYLPQLDLAPKESYVLEWELFAFKDVKDFFLKASDYDPFINLQVKSVSCGVDEQLTLTADRFIDKASIDEEDCNIANTKVGARVQLSFKDVGEKKLCLKYGDYKTFAYFNVYDNTISHIDRRINFIIDKQQVTDKESKYYGAYVLYDNEEEESFVLAGRVSNKNAARERAGMYCLMISRLLKGNIDIVFKKKIEDSLAIGIEFISREIVKEDGTVCDDVGYKKAFWKLHRRYNYAWYANIYALMYELKSDIKHLNMSIAILKKFYELDGVSFYAIGLPIMRIVALAQRDNLTDILAESKEMFLRHGDKIIDNGDDMPKHEVDFEQSIIAPAAHILLSCYSISADDKYLVGAQKYIDYLIAMNGYQPDFHMRDISIRHWDGYWFGKSKLYGDTFPHHWSCLTAEVFALYGNVKSNKSFVSRADNIFRNNLCLIDQEGRGSAAFIYPYHINGRQGHFYDTYANDQDWALYYMLEYSSEI